MQMANESRQDDRSRNTGSMPSQGSSGTSSTQSKSGEATKGGPGEGMKSGRPDEKRKGSSGQGNMSQQSNVDADRGGPSQQTSHAQDEEGQA